MDPDIRRIVAIDAHRRRTGRCPTLIYSLGTGEMFEVAPREDGFTDLQSGITAQIESAGIRLRGGTIVIESTGDVTFAGFDPVSNERFTGRAGGGVSVTIYDAREIDFFQYGVAIATPAA
jgi:hypothetical protein